MVQYARPDADDTDGSWTDKSGGTTLYTSIDEASADDATTFIKSTDDTGSSDECIVRLSDVSAPATSGTYIKYKALTEDATGSGPPGLKLELLQGSTVKATTTNYSVDTSSWTAYSYTISDVSGISDWTDLYMRITMLSSSAFGDYMKVTQVYLETQDAGAASTATPMALNTYQQLRNN